MLRKLSLQLFVIMLLTTTLSSVVLAAPQLQVKVNSSMISGVVTSQGHTLVPLKAFERFSGMTIQWDKKAKKATVKRDGTTIRITAGQRTAFINDKFVNLEVPAKMADGVPVVPLRFIAGALGAKVTVDAASRTIWVQERATSALMTDYSSSDLVKARIAALRIPLDESRPSRLTGDNEAMSDVYYFAKGKSDGYYVLSGQFVTYYEIKDGIRQAVWEADLSGVKKPSDKDIEAVFGLSVAKEYGQRPALAEEYVYYNTNIWGSSIIYGTVKVGGTPQEAGRITDWGDSRNPFIVAIPGESRR